MIISGYAGIGKSFLARNFPMVIDLESTPFEKDWDRYLKCAVHYHKQGFLVLISCHKEIRERILDHENGVLYGHRITVVPNIEDKQLYRQRYIDRGNSQEFIDVQMENWEKWLNEKENRFLTEQWEVLEKGETLYDCIIRLSKEQPHRFCNYDQCPVSGDCARMDGRCVNPLSEYVEKWKLSTIVNSRDVPMSDEILKKNGFEYFHKNFAALSYDHPLQLEMTKWPDENGIGLWEVGGVIKIRYISELETVLRLAGIDKKIEV